MGRAQLVEADSGQIAHTVREGPGILRDAETRRDPELDGRLAVAAVRAATREERLLPPNVNVFAGTLADLGGLTPLHYAVRAVGRLPWEVTLDVVPPYTHVPQRALLEAVGALLGVEGVETELQCAAALSADAQPAQGVLFAPSARLPVTGVYVPPRVPGPLPAPRSGPSVREFVRPALLRRSGAGAADRVAGGLRRAARRPGGGPGAVGAPVALPAVDVRALRPCPVRGPARGQTRGRVEEAVGLNPLTRLPGSDPITSEVDRRIAAGRAFALS